MKSSFNSRHVRVLLRKDFLTLKRNWMFFMTFLILPVAIMSGFSFLESIVEGEMAPERHNLDRKSISYFQHVFSDSVYTNMNENFWRDRRPFLQSDMKTDIYNRWQGLGNVTMMAGCGIRRSVGVIVDPFFYETFGSVFNDTIRKFLRPSILMNSLL